MTQIATYVLIGFGLFLLSIMGLIVILIAVNNSLEIAALFFCVLSGLGATMMSTVFSALDSQRKVDLAKQRKQDD